MSGNFFLFTNTTTTLNAKTFQDAEDIKKTMELNAFLLHAFKNSFVQLLERYKNVLQTSEITLKKII
jgi:hypothetical protein